MEETICNARLLCIFLIANLIDRILYDALAVCESEMSVIYDMEGKQW